MKLCCSIHDCRNDSNRTETTVTRNPEDEDPYVAEEQDEEEAVSDMDEWTPDFHWLTGDLGEHWGTEKKGKWVVVSFDPTTTKAQRDALAPIILKTYGLEWNELKVQEAPIEISRTEDIAEAKLGGGQMAYMKLKREPGADGKGVVLKNVNYFGAKGNEGFQLYRSLDHRADVAGHKFAYSDRNAFLISISTGEPTPPAMPATRK